MTTTKLTLLSLVAALLMNVGCGVEKLEDEDAVASSYCEAESDADVPDGIFGCMSAGTHRRIIAGQGGLSPSALASLRLWLRADLGVTQAGGTVSAWADQSGNSNRCSTASSFASQVDGLGNQKAIAFTSSSVLTSTTNVLPSGSPRTVFVVSQTPNLFGAGFLFQFRTASPAFASTWYQTGGVLQPDGSVKDAQTVVQDDRSSVIKIGAGVSFESPVIYEMTWDGNSANNPALCVNGAFKQVVNLSGSGTTSDTGTAGYTIRGGGSSSAAASKISEIAVFDSIITDRDRTIIRTAFSDRYRVPVGQ